MYINNEEEDMENVQRRTIQKVKKPGVYIQF